MAKRSDNTGRLWTEEGDLRTGPVATVALVGPFDRQYSYYIPDKLADRISLGQRVTILLGRKGRAVHGFCLSVDMRPWDNTLRPIEDVTDSQSFLTADLIELGRWIAEYYACPLGRALASLVPDSVRKQSGYVQTEIVRLSAPADQILAEHPRLGPKQRVLLQAISELGKPVESTHIMEKSGVSRAVLRSAILKGWLISERTRQPRPAPVFDRARDEPDFDLNVDQSAALEKTRSMIDSGAFCVALLFGVSGSGKTEVYVHAMRHALAAGRQVIMLVPEIALTTQLVHRLTSRFDRVAVVHSGLTGVERSLTWAAIRSGEKRVVIGTRSAVFAPCTNLGLIVVDEEQETSYKNLRAPRFHVRDVAIKRGQQLNIPVLLGSATPSIETWQNCKSLPHFTRIDLPHRVRNLPMPRVVVVDMNDEYQEKTGLRLLSQVTIRHLGESLERGEQAVLLMNRRGYANWLRCASCKLRINCPDCDAAMVLHAARNEMVCHHCGRRTAVPRVCPDPSCGGRLIGHGGGTQRVEERLARIFPDARIARADSDAMRNESTYRKLIAGFEAREIDCIVGTQMIAKGLDFPFVSFVGVIGADAIAVASDFRANERLFQLVTQVAGRAGRSRDAGLVVVQTSSPDASALRYAVRHDYVAFAKEELAIRQHTGMPPFSRMTRIVTADANEMRACDEAGAVVERSGTAIAKLELPHANAFGPEPCAVARVRGRYRYEVLLRTDTARSMKRLLDELRGAGIERCKAQSIMIDVDPVSFT